MNIIQEPHSLLYAKVFITKWPAPMSQNYDLTHVRGFFGEQHFDFEPPSDIKLEIRNLLREGGFSPSGRNKPACEYLAKAIEKGWFSPSHGINAAVDCCNAISLHSQLPISVIDITKATPPFSIRVCPKDTSYIFNPSGQILRADGLLALFDQHGPCGTSVKDAQRTKTDENTSQTLSVIWGHIDLQKYTDVVTQRYIELQNTLLIQDKHPQSTPIPIISMS